MRKARFFEVKVLLDDGEEATGEDLEVLLANKEEMRRQLRGGAEHCLALAETIRALPMLNPNVSTTALVAAVKFLADDWDQEVRDNPNRSLVRIMDEVVSQIAEEARSEVETEALFQEAAPGKTLAAGSRSEN